MVQARLNNGGTVKVLAETIFIRRLALQKMELWTTSTSIWTRTSRWTACPLGKRSNPESRGHGYERVVHYQTGTGRSVGHFYGCVNGSQLYATNQMVQENRQNITQLGNSLNKLDNRINRVDAGASALAALHPLDFDPDDKWDFAAGYGNYRGANAAAVGLYYRPNEDTMFSVGGSFGGGENMINAGVSLKIGRGNHVSNSRVAMAKEIRDLRQALADQAAEIA